MRMPGSDGAAVPSVSSVGAAARVCMSIDQQGFGFGDGLLRRHLVSILIRLVGACGRVTRLNVVVLAATEQGGHRAEGAGAGGEGERLGEAAAEWWGNEVG